MLFANTQAEPLEQAARGIGLLCEHKKEVAISTVSGKPLKLADQFTYLNSNISPTESYMNICIGKAWAAIDRLSIIWKFDISNKIKLNFFQAVLVLLYSCLT